MARSSATTERGEWRTGWPTVLGSALGAGGSALNAGALGAFMVPLAADTGWSRGAISGAFIFYGLNQIVLNPLVGSWIDRVGGRRVALAGILPFASAIASFALITDQIWVWYLAWFVAASFFPLVGPLAWSSLVTRAFERSRGLALGLMMCGNGIAFALAPLLAVKLNDALGWRGAYLALAAISLMMVLMGVAFLPAARRSASAAKAAALHLAEKIDVRAAKIDISAVLADTRFWKIAGPLAIAGAVASTLLIHAQPLIIDAGVSQGDAALVMLMLGPAAVIGRLLFGFLLDRFHPPAVAAAGLTIPVVPLGLLAAFDGSLPVAAIAIGLLGISFGAELDLLAFLAGRYFGRSNYGAIYGLMLSVFSILYTMAPMVAGLVYDISGGYRTLFLVLIPVSLAAAGVILTIEGRKGTRPTLPDAAPNS